MSLPSLSDLKAHLNNPSAADDDELQLILDAAVNVVEGIVGPLSSPTVTETHFAVASPVLVLRSFPVAALTSVSLRQYVGTAAAEVTSDYLLDPAQGTLRRTDGGYIRGDVTVTYIAGWDTPPAAVLLATLIIAAQLWETQRGAMPLPMQSSDAAPPINVGYAPGIPTRAKTLLEPFARPPGVA